LADFQVFHGAKKPYTQKAIHTLSEKEKPDPRNTLNDLSGKEWVRFLRSWFKFDALHSDLEEEKKVTVECRQHPATFSPTMISEFIRFFTKAQMKVLDPFSGIGSTLVACDRTERLGYGIDINPKFVDIAIKRTTNKQTIILGNTMRIDEMDLPKIDFCITSPPYWSMLHKIDVNQQVRVSKGLATKYSDLEEDLGNIADYGEFLKKLLSIFDKIYAILRQGAYLTVITQNIINGGVMIPFAWDLAIRMTTDLKYVLKKEKIWCQDHKTLHPFGYPYAWVSNTHHHYCLVFRKE
jgi:DNA modification methylase